jgi:nicotinate-nucleotide adenylyltransferase
MKRNWPLAFKGQKIGLLGGSFDPAHSGHLHVAETAIDLLGLDFVWWLVSPQNPLKKTSSPLANRMQSAQNIARGPKMVVTNIESHLGAQYTIDTLIQLKKHYPNVRFVWLMGGDNLAGFEHWRGWKDIVLEVPICVVSRPTAGPKARLGRMARQFERYRLPLHKARNLGNRKAPSWVYVPARFNPLSSTQLRTRKKPIA